MRSKASGSGSADLRLGTWNLPTANLAGSLDEGSGIFWVIVADWAERPSGASASHSDIILEREAKFLRRWALALLGHFFRQRRSEAGATMGTAGDGTPEPLKQHASNRRQGGLRRWS